MSKPISVDELVLDGGTQSRVEIDEYTVERYTDVLEAQTDSKWPFPPIVVFHDGNQYLVSSGFHRILAARRAKRSSVPCEVRQGTAWDALLFGMGANREHGKPPSRADNHHSVVLLLESGKKLSQKEIAETVGVTTRTVRRISAELQERTMSASEEDPFAVAETPKVSGKENGTESSRQEDSGKADAATEDKGGTTKNGNSGGAPSLQEQIATQRSKTVKTAEALMRAFDHLNGLSPKKNHEKVIEEVCELVMVARNWK